MSVEPVSLAYAPCTEHAALFLRWLQSPGGLTGYIAHPELAAAGGLGSADDLLQ